MTFAPSPDITVNASSETQNETALSLTVEKLVYGGDGLARHESGEVFFVPFSIPGESLLATRRRAGEKPARATIRSIETPDPERSAPRCTHFGTCGGCQWQHMQPSAQREWKGRIVAESLIRLGGFKDVNILSVRGSDDQSWHYRNRVQWDVSLHNDQVELGYSKAQSHQILTFETCHIIPDVFNAWHQLLLDILRTARWKSVAQAIQRIELTNNERGDTLLSLYAQGHPDLSDFAFAIMRGQQGRDRITGTLKGIVFFPQRPGHKRGNKHDTRLAPRALTGQTWLGHTLRKGTADERRYRVSAGSFFQTNPDAADALIAMLHEWLPDSMNRLLDVYAGVGLFGLSLSNRAKDVVLVEQSGSSLNDARHNITALQAENVSIAEGDASQALQTLDGQFDVAIIDPPRTGCSPEVLAWLSDNITNQLVYVSCNPSTLARDLKTLCASGWTIDRVQPIDMFPQTYHVETVVLLKREIA